MNYRLAVGMAAIIGVVSLTEESFAGGPPEFDRLDCQPPRTAAPPPPPSSDFDGMPTSKLEYDWKWNSHDTPEARVLGRVLGERKERNKESKEDLNRAIELFRIAAFVTPSDFEALPGRSRPVNNAMPHGNGAPGLMNYVPNGLPRPNRPGDTIAMQHLADMYRDGIGISQDAKQAKILTDCLAQNSGTKPQ